MKLNKMAFTLIELLVVVLIIGILAAIALPQYQKAVLKSKGSATFPLLKAIADAQERYNLTTGSYATDFDQLDIKIPGDCSPANTCVIGNDVWRILDGLATVYLGTKTPSNEYLTFSIVYDVETWTKERPTSTAKKGQILCFARNTKISSDKFTKICQAFSPAGYFDASASGGRVWIL
jgi:type IV pilus assembly protein PilE